MLKHNQEVQHVWGMKIRSKMENQKLRSFPLHKRSTPLANNERSARTNIQLQPSSYDLAGSFHAHNFLSEHLEIKWPLN